MRTSHVFSRHDLDLDDDPDVKKLSYFYFQVNNQPRRYRTGHRLLRTVNNQQHATELDHDKPAGHPPLDSSEEERNVLRSPESSPEPSYQRPKNAPTIKAPRRGLPQGNGKSREEPNRGEVRQAGRSGHGFAPRRADTTRTTGQWSALTSNETMSSEPRNFMDVDEEMGDFRPQKRARTGYGRSSSGTTYNIHAGFSQAKESKQSLGYGTTDRSGIRAPSISTSPELAHDKHRAVFRKPPSGFQIHADSSSQPGPSPPDSKFRMPPSLDDADLSSDEFNGRNTRAVARDRRRTTRNPLISEIPDINFRSTKDLLDKLDVGLDDSGIGSKAFKTYDLGVASTKSSSPLSSPPSSEALDHRAEHDDLDLPPVSSYTSRVECPICKEWIDRSCMEDFEAAYTRGKVMNVRTQTRFCRAHKRAGALATWQTRGYPKIEWETLEARLRRHHPRLEAVLKQREPSFYRNRLETKLNSGAGRIVEKGIDEMDEFVPGYYGSKGARLMTDSIMAAFSRTLRRLAVSDKLVSAIGVSGGVSGYVQAVLVPELAVSLVKEDLHLTDDDDDVRAREVLAESAEVGELVNEEEVERVRRRSGLDGARGEEWVELELGGEGEDDG